LKRRVTTTLQRLHRVGADPVRAARSLQAATRQLAPLQDACGSVLAQAAAKLAERPAAFRKTVARL
jgi:hypothetical protein